MCVFIDKNAGSIWMHVHCFSFLLGERSRNRLHLIKDQRDRNGTGMSHRTSGQEVQPVLRRLNQDLGTHQQESSYFLCLFFSPLPGVT